LAGIAYWINHSGAHRSGKLEYTLVPVEYGALSETVSATGLLQPGEVIVIGGTRLRRMSNCR
jgi:hypothetical protein